MLLEHGADPLRMDERWRTASDLDVERRLPILHPADKALEMLGEEDVIFGEQEPDDEEEGDEDGGGGGAVAAASDNGGDEGENGGTGNGKWYPPIDEGLESALLGQPREIEVTFGDGPMGIELDQSAAGLEIVAVEGAAYEVM